MSSARSGKQFDLDAFYERVGSLDDDVDAWREATDLQEAVIALACGKCRRTLAKGWIHPRKPSVVWDECGHFSESGVRARSQHSTRNTLNQSRPNVRYFDSTSHSHPKGSPLRGHPTGERRYTFACIARCGMRRTVRNDRMVRVLLQAVTAGRKDLVLGIDL